MEAKKTWSSIGASIITAFKEFLSAGYPTDGNLYNNPFDLMDYENCDMW